VTGYRVGPRAQPKMGPHPKGNWVTGPWERRLPVRTVLINRAARNTGTAHPGGIEMNRMIPLYVTLSTFVQDQAERVQKRYVGKDRGASIIEYVALLFVVALIVAAIHAAHIDKTVQKKAGEAMKKIFK
jgi:hypothetical protein